MILPKMLNFFFGIALPGLQTNLIFWSRGITQEDTVINTKEE